ncbi:MAG: GmrSD restriction endonuclease domain-containing protein [Candidatus Limnocylindria bacterium]
MTTIMGLLNQIGEKEVVLPAIQRDFVWSEPQTAKLLDSIMRGYPVGIVLLWETYTDIQYRPFVADFRSGTVHSYDDNAAKRRIRVVLDGQQRLQSLYIALRGKRDGRELYLDVLSGQDSDNVADDRYLFEFMTQEQAERRNSATVKDRKAANDDNDTPYWWKSARELFGMSARERRDFVKDTTRRLRLTDDQELLLDSNLATFDEVLTRDENILKLSTIDESLPADSPYRKSEADVLEIFVRVNREGTPLSRSDLIFSMLKLSWKESAEGLPEFVDAINDGNSFSLDTDFVVRSLFSVSDLGSRLDLDLLRKRSNVEALKAKFSRCCDAIRSTVDFVRRECKCESSSLLGSAHTLIPFVYYFFHLPKHDVPNDQVDRVRTSIYLVALAKPFSRYSESRPGNFIRSNLQPLVKKHDRSFPLEDTIDRVRRWEKVQSITELAQANVHLTLHLIQGLSGAAVQYKGNAPEVDHIFPRSELRTREVDEDLINDLANFWILIQGKNRNKSNRKPSEYFADVSKRQLKDALIDPELLEYRLYKRFVETRRAAMAERLEALLGLHDADLRGQN